MFAIPRLSFSTHAPRRVFVPFELSSGEHADQLWETVKQDRKVGNSREIMAFLQTPKPNAKGPNDFVVGAAKLQPNGRADVSMWRSGVSGWHVLGNGTAERPEGTDGLGLPEHQVLDIAIGLGGPREFGLFVTWNPGLSVFQHVFLGPGDTVRLANPSSYQAEETRRSYLQASGGAPFLLVDIPIVALLPASTAEEKYGPRLPDKLPATSFFSFGGLKIEWQFASPRLHLSAPSRRQNDDHDRGFGIAIDFGTSASTVALFPLVQGFTPNALRAADPVSDLMSWAMCTEVVDAATLKGKTGTAVVHRLWFTDGGHAIGDCPGHPRFIDGRRSPSRGHAQVPSILHTPDFKTNRANDPHPRVDQEHVTDEKSEPQCYIGDEVRQLIDEGIRHHPADVAARADWERFIYAPKSRVGRKETKSLPGCEKPIEAYLRELFDQAFVTATASEGTPFRSLRSVTYSYPVTWTDHQRLEYMTHLRAALEKSLLAPCLPASGSTDLVTQAHSMDEASAAFLGFVMKRFSGLEGLDLLHAYQPFNPGGSGDPAQLVPINVLVFDCGEGTTDIVWLEISQTIDGETGKPARYVDSHVKRHFASERAGLEVTRLVAQRVKELLIRANGDDDGRVRSWLCTKLVGVAKEVLDGFDHQIGSPRAPHRMGLVHLFYQVAERLKINGDLGPRRKDLLERLQSGKLMGGADVSIEEDALGDIVAEVFDVAVDQVRSWFEQGPRVDAVIMSGRSCRLPKLEAMIRDAIPRQHRPYAIDFVTPDCFVLEQATESEADDDQIGKTSVVTGLVLNRYNAQAVLGRALRCHPIDSMKRTRAIGVMARGITANNKPYFADEFQLLVESDNGAIDSTVDLGPILIEKGEARGFSIGINFSGKKTSDQDKVDPVQEFIGVDIQGGSNESVDSISLFFRQYTSTDLRISKVTVKKPDASETSKNVAPNDFGKPITVGAVKVLCTPYSADTDFRNTGKIHIDADNSIDL